VFRIKKRCIFENQNKEKMKTKIAQNLENQIVTINNNLKFAQHFECVCTAFQQKEKFSFVSLRLEEVNLFEHETMFNFSGLSLKDYQVKHFEDMFEICNNKKIDDLIWIQVIKSCRYVVKNIDKDENDVIAKQIANEIFNN
jgi:hypothetical protein